MNAMNDRTGEKRRTRCANETCDRPAEPGDLHCSECGLERSLFLRDARTDADRIRRAWEDGRAGR